MDVNCGSCVRTNARLALEKKKLQESDIDRALRNIFSIRMRLGLFNGDPRKLEYGDIATTEVCSKKHQDLSLEAARNGIVLLKNSPKLLPLSKNKTTSLAVIGPKANDAELLLGNYAGIPCNNVSLLQGFQRVVKNIGYHPGCNFVNCTSAATHEAIDVAKKAQYVVLIMGLDQRMERESWDRTELGLPGQQETLIKAVAKAAAEPVILVLVGGGPIDISFAKNNPKVGGILWIGYPGEAGAAALTRIIFGEHNPGGRLPVTWYPKEFTKVPMSDMNMRPNSTTGYPGRTYRFYKGPKVYEFGYGLSYTSYSYKIDSVNHDKLYFDNLTTDKARKHGSLLNVAVSDIGSEACKMAKISVKVVVKNKGKIAGKHPVLLFLRHPKVRDEVPIKQLIGFKSVRIDAGETTKIKFVVNPCEHFTRANEYGISVIDEGKYYLVVEDKKYPVIVFI
ncbi:putative beta-d-xylosidase 7 [Nicotiana attenuata]|uniref:Beta-d-xylosidase 7 n=2 Tax=Nicotiana attenuata TaxID=49451 RepID=A0A1J6I382_NICAT|nr:putative beta-d-xylosidase 7 [Nicotiana attenuata]